MDATPLTVLPLGMPRESILVVDDEDHIRFGLSLTLRKAGYRVTEARNAIVALDCLRQRANGPEAFALMILDLRMPLMSGARMLSIMDSQGLRLPVIGITGCTEADAVSQLEDAGCLAVLTKPFTTEDLLASIVSALAQPPASCAQQDQGGGAP